MSKKLFKKCHSERSEESLGLENGEYKRFLAPLEMTKLSSLEFLNSF